VSFNAWTFPVFFFVVCAAYHALPGDRLRKAWLLAASLAFYATWDWRFVAPLLISGTIDFYVSRAMAARPDPARRKPLLWISVAANLGFLAYFKYAGLFVESVEAASGALGLGIRFAPLRVLLPVGMSFYTFHALSYVIDVYRGHVEPADSLTDFLLFLAYFPQLVSGPIARAKSLLPQVAAPRRPTADDVDAAVPLILWGYFKKLVVADHLVRVVSFAFGRRGEASGLDLTLGALAAFIQIYCDFSGFIDIARGCSRLMGIELQRNFERPFFSQTPIEFWRRWNTSLSAWLKDYVYIPLGGDREGRVRTAVNVTATMALSGLWHGAHWHMVVWGMYEGSLQLIWRRARERLPILEQTHGVVAALKRLVTFAACAFGTILFRAANFGEAAAYVAGLGVKAGPHTAFVAATIAFFSWPVFAWDALEEFAGGFVEKAAAHPAARPLAYGALLVALAIFSARKSPPFVYYQF
jgi:D-alanyl-lipoteichoic acid acyltransferase DltB (MBOAT superfamily)